RLGISLYELCYRCFASFDHHGSCVTHRWSKTSTTSGRDERAFEPAPFDSATDSESPPAHARCRRSTACHRFEPATTTRGYFKGYDQAECQQRSFPAGLRVRRT